MPIEQCPIVVAGIKRYSGGCIYGIQLDHTLPDTAPPRNTTLPLRDFSPKMETPSWYLKMRMQKPTEKVEMGETKVVCVMKEELSNNC
jgi:hypothetical protein